MRNSFFLQVFLNEETLAGPSGNQGNQGLFFPGPPSDAAPEDSGLLLPDVVQQLTVYMTGHCSLQSWEPKKEKIEGNSLS